jgi:hypothetical protein
MYPPVVKDAIRRSRMRDVSSPSAVRGAWLRGAFWPRAPTAFTTACATSPTNTGWTRVDPSRKKGKIGEIRVIAARDRKRASPWPKRMLGIASGHASRAASSPRALERTTTTLNPHRHRYRKVWTNLRDPQPHSRSCDLLRSVDNAPPGRLPRPAQRKGRPRRPIPLIRGALARSVSEAAGYITERGLVEQGAPAIVRFIMQSLPTSPDGIIVI